jgi:hypothetical protein
MKTRKSFLYLAMAAVFCINLVTITGCAGFGKFSSGAQTVVDFICNPSDTQKAEAAKWVQAATVLQDTAAMFFPLAGKSIAAMTVLKNGGCFVVSEVQTALQLLSDMQAKDASVKGLKAAPKSIQAQFPVLWETVYGK